MHVRVWIPRDKRAQARPRWSRSAAFRASWAVTRAGCHSTGSARCEFSTCWSSKRRRLAKPDSETTHVQEALDEHDGLTATPRFGITGTGSGNDRLKPHRPRAHGGRRAHRLRQELLPDVRVTLIEPGVVATELPQHITHGETREDVQALYDKVEVTADDIAEIIAFSLSRPRRLAINEILLRPAGQA